VTGPRTVLMAMLAVLAAGQDNGGVIEVKNGDLHIDLQDAGGKVFISVKGGAEIELFDMAARLQALEIAVGEQNSLRDDFNELREKVDKNQDSAATLDDRLADAETQVAENTNSTDEVNERLVAAEEKLITAQEELAVVPEMTACAAKSLIYHPENGKCQPAVDVHCNMLSRDEHSNLLIAGSRLVNNAMCSFNQHYGGQSCAASCLPGALLKLNSGEDAGVTFSDLDDAVFAGNDAHVCLSSKIGDTGEVEWLVNGQGENSWTGTLEAAKALCTKTEGCLFLHDWGGDFSKFRVCKNVKLRDSGQARVIKVSRGAKYTCNLDGEWAANFKCDIMACEAVDEEGGRLTLNSDAIANGATRTLRNPGMDGIKNNTHGAQWTFSCPRGKKAVHVDGVSKIEGTWSSCLESSIDDFKTSEWSKPFNVLDCK